jgi:hypothetical protein
MPNWSTNILTVEGAERDVALLAGELDGCVLDADAVVAVSGMLAGGDDRVGEFVGEMLAGGKVVTFDAHVPDPLARVGEHGDWYRARIRAWGTKWDAFGVAVLDRCHGRVRYRFDTAWCPPVEWFQTLCELRPGMRMELAAVEESEVWLGTWTSEADESQVVWCGDGIDDETMTELFGWCPADWDNE